MKEWSTITRDGFILAIGYMIGGCHAALDYGHAHDLWFGIPAVIILIIFAVRAHREWRSEEPSNGYRNSEREAR